MHIKLETVAVKLTLTCTVDVETMIRHRCLFLLAVPNTVGLPHAAVAPAPERHVPWFFSPRFRGIPTL